MNMLDHGYRRALAALACTLAVLALLTVSQGTARAQGDEATGPATDAASQSSASQSDANKSDANQSDANQSDANKNSATLRTTQICIDKEIANRLAVKRKRRGAVDRLFIKQARHEITGMGGYYSSDLFSGTYVAGGSYTYHMTEDTAVEFGAAITHANADIIAAIEDSRGSILDDDFARVLLVESLLVWSPVYGKLRLGGTIMRFDINLGAGVGVVDSQTSRGAAGVAGVGLKLFIGKALAVRIDARNHVFRQELLDERFLVNDVAVTTGLSLFLPLRN